MARTSVIIPAYDVETTIERAVVSVLNQTDRDLEVIVIDDASPDTSGRILDELTKRLDDARLHVIHHPVNRGVSAARNAGLDVASGDFYAFLDGDDYWAPRYLEVMHERIGSADVAVCGRRIRQYSGEYSYAASAFQGVTSGQDAASKILAGTITPFLWDKLFRASLCARLRFPESIRRYEDQMLAASACSYAGRVISFDDPLITYNIGTSSLTWGRVPALKELHDAMDFFLSTVNDSWLDSEQATDAVVAGRVASLVLAYQSALRSTEDQHDDLVRAVREQFTPRNILITIRANPTVGIAALLGRLAPSIYTYLYAAYTRRTYGLDQ